VPELERSYMTIKVESDFDGFFENFVRGLLERKKDLPKHEEIVISAGPFRPSAISYASDGKTLRLDFYSALRNGFGSLSEQELVDLTALL